MLTEKIVLQRKHSATKHISVLLISIGISIYTFASSTMEPMEKVNTQDTFINWMFGIAMLSTSLVLSARMGVYQEEIHNRFGRHPREALFYTVRKFYYIWNFFKSIFFMHYQVLMSFRVLFKIWTALRYKYTPLAKMHWCKLTKPLFDLPRLSKGHYTYITICIMGGFGQIQ